MINVIILDEDNKVIAPAEENFAAVADPNLSSSYWWIDTEQGITTDSDEIILKTNEPYDLKNN